MLKQIIKIPYLYMMLIILYLAGGQVAARSLPEFATLVKENGPAVVNITTSKKVSPKEMIPERYRREPGSEELFDDLMKRFFGGEGGGNTF